MFGKVALTFRSEFRLKVYVIHLFGCGRIDRADTLRLVTNMGMRLCGFDQYAQGGELFNAGERGFVRGQGVNSMMKARLCSNRRQGLGLPR